MTYGTIQNSFIAGEISPELYGRTDLAKWRNGASTMRNAFANYRGGSSSRAGTAYVGMCKQTRINNQIPPRFIPFQFSINQGYALEFGEQYMRIISDGAYVVEAANPIIAVTKANPGVFTYTNTNYTLANGDWIFIENLPGSLQNTVYAVDASTNTLNIINNGSVSAVVVGNMPQAVCVTSDGSRAYVANTTDNTVSVVNTLTQSVIATITVGTSPQGIAITPAGDEVYVANFGSANVSVIATASNTVTHTIAVNSLPTSVAIKPNGVTAYITCEGGGGSVVPITISTHTALTPITVGTTPKCASVTPDSGHVYVTNSNSNNVSVIATASNTVVATITVGGSPEGCVCTPDGTQVYVANLLTNNVSVIATVSNTVIHTISVAVNPFAIGASLDSAFIYVNSYSTGTLSTIATATNTVVATTAIGSPLLSDSQALFVSSLPGTTGDYASLNGLIWIVQGVSGSTFHLTDLFGNNVNTSTFAPYTSGGSLLRVYTVVSPYAAVDLPYLKFTQSADTMSMACVNSVTQTEYPPYDLERFGGTDWTFTQTTFAASIVAPTGAAAVAQNSTTVSTWYSYVVTAVNASGEESIASNVATIENNDISVNAGSNTITWNAVSNAVSYNIYKATPSYSVGVPIGSLFGFMGTAFGTQFTDTNIQADFTVVPPTHNNPFARSAIAGIVLTNSGSGLTQATVGYTITTSTGSGFVGLPVIIGGQLQTMIVQDAGQNYALTDIITFTGTHVVQATANLLFGAATGTYPSTVAYFQQRRFYANTLDEPDTYFATKPGLFNNMDTSNPIQANDAIIGTPWAQQVNGIQFLVPMPGGLVVLTGKGAWQLNGGSSAALTPGDETATPQAYNGCNNRVPPLVINYDILYVQSKGSIVRDLAYNFFVNIYTGTDLTVLSNHLFTDHQILEWAWCEEPYKLVWAVREDGVLLSLTYLKEQDVYGWARHDTNGLFVSVCSITEPPVDALYTVVQRTVRGQPVYYAERMDDRDWANVEQCFCVDAGLQWPMTFPNATLTAGGTAVGTTTAWAASAGVFSTASVGQIIRLGGGKGVVASYINANNVTVTITQAVTGTVPNDPNNAPIPAVAGNWSITPSTSVVSGLNHLEGLTVAILVDGSVVANQVVANGTITLPTAYSAITIGLPYLPQVQTLYLEPPGQPHTTQGKRKNIYSMTARVSSSRGISVGTNQPDASTQPNNATVAWTNMKQVKERNATIPPGTAIPLVTGDEYILVPADWETQGQVAIQQNFPLPMNILAVIANYQIGDSDG